MGVVSVVQPRVRTYQSGALCGWFRFIENIHMYYVLNKVRASMWSFVLLPTKLTLSDDNL